MTGGCGPDHQVRRGHCNAPGGDRRVPWADLNTRTKMLAIRDRKDPRQKKGNDQRIPS